MSLLLPPPSSVPCLGGILLLACLMAGRLEAATLHVGPGQMYANLAQAVAVVLPGDTIEIHAGTYAGGLYFANLQGTPNQWITLRSAANETVLFEGGSNAIQLSDPAYLHIRGLTFQKQTGNGVNIDDGGSYSSPAHHLVLEQCTFRDMNATGNNDLLKLSGLDHFQVRQCRFLNGSAGGSGVDMVGCHDGLIVGNYFENQGTNSIQAKGGTARVGIEANFFKDGGQRTLNLGGSTGLQFFRPDTAHYEAAQLSVFANVFVGSWAPIAYVGAVYVEVANNTFYAPENWVIRILQETVDTTRFLACGDNWFVNNIVYLDHTLSTETNIGPNTRPESFTFSHNLWYNAASPNWPGPKIPTPDPFQIVQDDPLFALPAADDFSIPPHSPAAGKGRAVAAPVLDFGRRPYALPRSIGAWEAKPLSGLLPAQPEHISLHIAPNPAAEGVWVKTHFSQASVVGLAVYEATGRLVKTLPTRPLPAGEHSWFLPLEVPPGHYFLHLQLPGQVVVRPLIIH